MAHEYKYDFTSIIDRIGKDAIAVEAVGNGGNAPDQPQEGFDFIPMWVADMNFATAPTIPATIKERLEHPLFGYFSPTKEYYDSIIRWQKDHHQVESLLPEHIGYDHGVLGGVVATAHCFAAPGDKVLVHSPTYVGFTGSMANAGFTLVHSEMKQDENGVYRMDYADMEEKIASNRIHLAIFCSPHNPTGRVWEKEEIAKAMEIFEKYQVTVISDEIWSDIILNGNKHTPTQSVSEYARMNTVACYAPTKTFNLAGLVGSYHIIYNPAIKDRVEAQASKSHYNNMNVLSMHGLIGAYKKEGAEWLEELKLVLSSNVNYACDFIQKELDGVEVTKPEGTYMLFIDCSKWCSKYGKTIKEVLKMGWNVGIGWQDGTAFFGPCHIRLNLALPEEKVKIAMNRMKEYVFTE